LKRAYSLGQKRWFLKQLPESVSLNPDKSAFGRLVSLDRTEMATVYIRCKSLQRVDTDHRHSHTSDTIDGSGEDVLFQAHIRTA
jgi:hypothetical protein